MIPNLLLSIGNLIISSIQIPREVPHPKNNTPIDLSNIEDVIIYIILPLVVVVLLFVRRRYQKTESKDRP